MDFGTKKDDLCCFAYDNINNQLAGAVWLRKFRKENAGYGFVSESVPEVSIAVDYSYRGKGIGTELMKHLFSNIPAHIDSVSLSVDTRNRAYTLYQKLGFKDVSIDNGTAIMIVKVADFNII